MLRTWFVLSAFGAASVILNVGAVSGQAHACAGYPDMAMRAPRVDTSPGAEYAEWARSYQGMPTIERMANGRLWAGWTAGGMNEGPANHVLLVTSDDDGESWTDPQLVIDPPGNVAAFMPILWRDPIERLWLFWNQGFGAWWDGRGGAWVVIAEGGSTGAPNWSEARRISHGWPGGKPIVLGSGEWLLPVFVHHRPAEVADENQYYRLGLTPCVIEALSHDLGSLKGANVYRSADMGNTWEFHGQANWPVPSGPADVDINEHLLVEREDGTLWMLARTPPGIGESFSTDGGRTWTPVTASGIRHPLSRFFVRRLHSGRIVMVRHDPPEVTYPADCEDCGEMNRSHLTAYVSEDEGRSWKGGLIIDERETVSYPDGVQADDGRIFLVYDRNRYTDREVWMAVFSEADVLASRCAARSCRLRVRVSSNPTR